MRIAFFGSYFLNFEKIIKNCSIKNNSNSLKSLDLLYIDCGNKDQYGIQYGSRKLIKILQKHGIEHRWEEFEGTHSGIEHRLDISMPMLAKVLYN